MGDTIAQTRVESSDDNEDLGEDASKQGRKIHDIDADEDITLVNDQDDEQMFNVVEEEVKDINTAKLIVNSITTTDSAAATMTINEVTLTQALMEIKSTKPKAKGIVIQEPSESRTTTTTTIISSKKSQDKELQAKFNKDQRLAIEKDQQEEEANIALIETWDDIQAKINADYQLAERLQAEEQQELNDAEKATLFMQLLVKRKRFFTAKRAEEKKNRPPTRAQQRSIMCTYLKNMKGWKPNSLKNKSFANIQELFNKAIKRSTMLGGLTAKGITSIATPSSSAQFLLSLNILSLLLLQLSWNSLLPTQFCSQQ
nr:hypothetical protein [Tanacetum cinerariifolium]